MKTISAALHTPIGMKRLRGHVRAFKGEVVPAQVEESHHTDASHSSMLSSTAGLLKNTLFPLSPSKPSAPPELWHLTPPRTLGKKHFHHHSILFMLAHN